jgi:aspartyl-tRNA(Asn)/glutamyl-tRNA(Gln) amidotransferase subunit A
LPKEFFAEGLDDGVAKAIMAAVKEFEALGAVVKEISLKINM